MAVHAVHAERVDERGEPVVGQVGPQSAGERERAARLDAGRFEDEVISAFSSS